MSDVQGIPAVPPDRDLPNHRRIRADLLMQIDPEDQRVPLRRSWGLPLSVAAGVAAVSVVAVTVFGGHATGRPTLATTALGTGVPGGSGAASAGPSATASAGPTRGTGSAGGGTPPSSQVAPTTVSWTFTSGRTTPIDAGSVSGILDSCLGSDASGYHAVIAVRAAVASSDWDGAVVAVNSGGQYVQCETKGDRGSSQASPPTFINNRLWNAGHTIEFFDSMGEPAAQGQYLSLGAGHYTADVAKITVSYGSDSTEYPVTMAGGAFFYASDMTDGASGTGSSGPGSFVPGPTPYIHAYNAAGQEIYNQVKDA